MLMIMDPDSEMDSLETKSSRFVGCSIRPPTRVALIVDAGVYAISALKVKPDGRYLGISV